MFMYMQLFPKGWLSKLAGSDRLRRQEGARRVARGQRHGALDAQHPLPRAKVINPKTSTPNPLSPGPKPETLNPKTSTRNPLSPKPETLNPRTSTLNPLSPKR